VGHPSYGATDPELMSHCEVGVIIMDFRLRPAKPSDREFIWRLRVATMKDMIEAAYGWDEATQRAYADESLGGMIVLVGEEPVGVLTLADWGDQLHVVWMPSSQKCKAAGLELHWSSTVSNRHFKLESP
jgi:hypothetical protein